MKTLRLKKKKRRTPFDHLKLLKLQIVAYLDVLGLRSQMVAVQSNPTEGERLGRRYRTSFRRALKTLDINQQNHNWSYRIFTDNVVLATVCDTSDPEPDIGAIITDVASFQLSLALDGWFLRGGLSLGLFYIDNSVLFGPALIDAYELEVNKARDPRVVLSSSLATLTRRHLDYYAEPYTSPQNGYIVTDPDGFCFINYLYLAIDMHGSRAAREAMLVHKKQVIKGLRRYREDPRILTKYWWLASYHNFACEKWFPTQPQIRIPRTALGSGPMLFVEKPKRKGRDWLLTVGG